MLLPFSVDFDPPDDRKKKILITVGAVLLVSSLIVLILGILWWKGCLGGRTSREKGNLIQISLTSPNTHEAVLLSFKMQPKQMSKKDLNNQVSVYERKDY